MRLVTVAVVLLVLAGCSVVREATAPALWTPAAGQEISATTTRLDVLVTRAGCNSGVTGEVQEPTVRVEDDRVVVAFEVTPGPPEAAGCPGNPEVPYTLTLPEPLGDRALVDGSCLTDEDAARTSSCRVDGGIRHQP